ncbi:hypothetical protein GCM10007036_05460 [Alsobacter metallidurans]|uniref:Glucosamine inositolphosphorylceramide transferase 1 N-terminal domain-containing protein n=1 Tax=Alsobacter metallidurans TaxID=340221 RepID=A0A917MGC6_9HYPH|nr:formyl transferase [Alsobacter metallidurans]GGH09417.1 hypothetical protein GCM10007036_05460 [Alsobacter metallidurans]
MKIALRLPAGPALRWHLGLAERLRSAGHRVVVQHGTAPASLPADLAALVWFERRVFGRALSALDPAPELQSDLVDDAPIDLVMDLTGGDPAEAGPALRPEFDGAPGWPALYAALLAERSPTLSVRRIPAGRIAATGLAALPQPALLSSSLEAVLARLSLLLVSAVTAVGGVETAAAPPAPDHTGALTFGASQFVRGVERKIRSLAEHPAHWRIGWRKAGAGEDLYDRQAWPANGYTWLQPGAGRYVADPFVISRGGQFCVFCEVFDYADPRGKIGVFTLDAEGRAGPLSIVLERPYHLSYPFVFERDGQVWMIPETYENRSVELYRAERFPDRWVKEADILTGVELSDVTLAEHDGRFWMFAADTAGGQTSWDALSLFMADHWRGPWTPHPLNPVLVDARAARPAGMLERRRGVLFRPAQDCRGGYGAGLSICRVDRLDPEGFSQTVLASLPPIGLRDTGAHTLNIGGGIEVVDHCAPMRRR